MKTTLLFSTVFLFSTASFAQTTVKNSEAIKNKTSIQSSNAGSQIDNSGNASSATSIQSNAVNKTQSKSYAEIKKGKKAAITEKHTLASEAKAKGEESKKAASQNHTVSVSTHSNTNANASEKDNNLGNNTSLDNGAAPSSAKIKNSGNQVKDEEKAAIISKTNATMENSNHAKTTATKTAIKAGEKINTASSTAVHAGAASAHSIHVKPVSVKTGTMIKTNAGIKL